MNSDICCESFRHRTKMAEAIVRYSCRTAEGINASYWHPEGFLQGGCSSRMQTTKTQTEVICMLQNDADRRCDRSRERLWIRQEWSQKAPQIQDKVRVALSVRRESTEMLESRRVLPSTSSTSLPHTSFPEASADPGPPEFCECLTSFAVIVPRQTKRNFHSCPPGLNRVSGITSHHQWRE